MRTRLRLNDWLVERERRNRRRKRHHDRRPPLAGEIYRRELMRTARRETLGEGR